MLCLVVLTAGVTAALSYLLFLLKPAPNGKSCSSTTLDAFIEPCVTTPKGKDSGRAQSSYTEPGRQMLLMFATEYGFSEELAHTLLDRLCKLSAKREGQWQPRLLSARHHQYVQWDRETICFFVVSTCGDGVFPADCRSLITFLHTSSPCLRHLNVSLLALGDSSYPHFCRAGLQLASRLSELGAQEVVATTRVDGEDWGVIEGWMDRVERWISRREAEDACPDIRQDYLNMEDIMEDSSASNYSRSRPFLATLKTKQLLTHTEDVFTDRETVHCEVDMDGSGLTWTPGDSLGLYAENSPASVDAVLAALALTGQEMLPEVKPAFRGQGEMSVREALQWCYDVKKATPATLSVLNQHLTSVVGPDCKLSDLLSSKEQCRAYLDSRRLVQVLHDWCGAPLPAPPPVDMVHSFLRTLRPLQPRYYSISSSPLLDGNRLSLTVAVVRYMDEGREEGGVATTYLQDRLEVNQKLPVFINSNPDFRLPPSASTPIVLVSAGTGVAPFRAFIQTRELTSSQGEIHLYFGCRHPEKDFLYRQQIERWQASGIVRARIAFSRYHGRTYVQDLLKEDSVLLWNLLNEAGAVVYVCGDAGRFAPDVHKMLVSIIQQQGQRSATDAHSYLMELQHAGRYQKDVWLS